MAPIVVHLSSVLLLATLCALLIRAEDREDQKDFMAQEASPVQLREMLSSLFPSLVKHHYVLRQNDVEMPEEEEMAMGKSQETIDISSRSTYDINEPKSLCEMVRVRRDMESDGYEYRPSFYYEFLCKTHYFFSDTYPALDTSTNKYCYHSGKGCENRTQQVHLYRRKIGSECWEHHPKLVSLGCSCKLPSLSANKVP